MRFVNRLPDEHAPYRLHYYGEEALRAPVVPVVSAQAIPTRLIAALRAACRLHQAVGLAAQHVGGTEAVIVVSLDHEFVAMLNPVITSRSETTTLGTEGSVSSPGFHASVSRADWITVAYNDESFTRVERKLAGWDARVVQHEIDHLNGVLLFDGLARQQKRQAARLAEPFIPTPAGR
jgi:peptide deformylase